MRPQTVQFPTLDLRAEVGAIDAESRVVELVFSTGAPVMRFDWWTGKRFIEKLSMKPEHIRLERLNRGAPLLNTHSSWSLANQIGVVEDDSARIVGGKGLSKVRFSKRADVEPFYQDVRDRIIRNVSVGYMVHKYEETTGRDGSIPTRTAVDWEPYEISMVPMPADASAQVRGGQVPVHPCVIVPAGRDVADADRARALRLAKVRY